HEPLCVTLLPPRVGKVEARDRDARVGEASDGAPRIFGEHARSVGEPSVVQAPVHDGGPLQANLESDDARIRRLGEALEDEAAAPRPYLELHGTTPAVDQSPRIHGRALGEPGSDRGVGVVLHGKVGSSRGVVRRRAARSPFEALMPFLHRAGRLLHRHLLAGSALPVLLVLATTGLAFVTLRRILEVSGGVPSVPLDDAYIHFQFARSFAEGTPLVYSPG